MKINDQLKIEYFDFKYAIINPKNLIGIDEFNQSFFDKIDQIEIDISNENFILKILVENLQYSKIKKIILNFHQIKMK